MARNLKPTLRAVDPASVVANKKPKILVYGREGVGKTYNSLDFPNCYFIDCEDASNIDHYLAKLSKSGGQYMGLAHGALDFDVVIEQVQALATQQHSFKTLIIDSISKLFNTAVAIEAERLGEKNAFGADKKPAIAQMRRLINWLMRIDMNVILIAHEKNEWSNNEKVGTTFDCWDKLGYELDLSLRVVLNGPARVAHVVKTRLKEFPSSSYFPWTFEEFSKRYGKLIIDKASEPIQLASDEQIKEIENLLEVVKLKEGQVEKWLNAAQVGSWHEMSSNIIAKIIAGIKKNYLNTETGAE